MSSEPAAALLAARPRGLPSEWSPLEWAALQLAVLYRSDDRGRMLAPAEPGGRAAPLFHLVRTRMGNLWRFHAALPQDAVVALARLAAREGPVREPGLPPERMEPFRRVLEQVSLPGRPPREPVVSAGPAFHFPYEIAAPAASVRLREVTAETPDAAAALRDALGDDADDIAHRQPCVIAVVEDRAVARCSVARGEARVAAEASLDTLQGYRRQGFGRAVTAHWARCVRACGGEPLYSTEWSNRASRAVAASLDLVPYGEDWHWS